MEDWLGGPAWLAAALVLGIAELLVPGIFLIFLAIAAAITALASYVLPDLPPVAQVAAFAMWSVVAVLIGRRWYRDYPVESDARLNDRAARLIGEIVVVDTELRQGRGRVRIGDGSWPATGPDLPQGAAARIVAVEGGIVAVEALPDIAAPRP
ncbi:NfeD family protein [Sphingomonas abaci]|uniref:NfeD family protein n=1 Tax=Sphingomonas abaci TaxID=237611 RepID=UPI00161365EC|nr:NfeD family protein [Sphingomonas abaci]